jgi:hypothetical protein
MKCTATKRLWASREGTVEETEQHHGRKADQIDMGVQMRLLEALVDANPDAEPKPKIP